MNIKITSRDNKKFYVDFERICDERAWAHFSNHYGDSSSLSFEIDDARECWPHEFADLEMDGYCLHDLILGILYGVERDEKSERQYWPSGSAEQCAIEDAVSEALTGFINSPWY